MWEFARFREYQDRALAQAVLAIALWTTVTMTGPRRPALERRWESRASMLAWLLPLCCVLLPTADLVVGE